MSTLSDQTGLDAAAQAGGLPQGADLTSIVGYIINTLLGVLGIVFFVLILIGGFQWMTSGGDESKIKAAKQRMGSAVIGLAIVLTSYAITLFVINIFN
jgi:TRAP-type C4-dicarboxylate transport system permease small subunit